MYSAKMYLNCSKTPYVVSTKGKNLFLQLIPSHIQQFYSIVIYFHMIHAVSADLEFIKLLLSTSQY